MLCIYCNTAEADAREHYLPQCLGRFEDFEPLLDRLCKECNHALGGEIEREFCRRSPEAVFRSVHWIKGQSRSGKNKRATHIYEPEKTGGRHMYMFGLDADGHNILWQTGEQPGTIKEISQIVILDADDKAIEHIPIPTAIATGRELIQILFNQRNAMSIEKALLIAAPGDEDRVQALFAEINVAAPMERRKAGPVSQQFFVGEITSVYFRALAKIGFHYALRYIPTITGNETTFKPLREFIWHGVGNGNQFLTCLEAAPNPNCTPGHLLTVVARPNSPIVVNMQFFAGCKKALPIWRLILGDNPTLLFLDKSQGSKHFFAYNEDSRGQLTGGKVVAMPLLFQDDTPL